MSAMDSLSSLRGKGPATFADIPDEILLEILDWLPRGSAYVSFALVCSRMHRISRPAAVRVFRVGSRNLEKSLLEPEGRLSILAVSSLASFCRELVIYSTSRYILNISAFESNRLCAILPLLVGLQTLRIESAYLTFTLLQTILDHPTLQTLDYEELATALSLSWRKLSPEQREHGFSSLSTSPPLRVPNLLVGSLPSRRNLNSARYPALARDALLSSGRFTFDTVNLVDLPTLPSSHAWTPIPGLRRIIFNELPLIGEGPGLASWFEEIIALQPELTTLEIELLDDHLPEDSNPERTTALSLIPWFGQVAFMNEQLLTKHSHFKGLKITTTKGGIVAANFAFNNVKGIPQFLQQAALSIPTLKTLEITSGLEYPAWNDVLRAMSSFNYLTSLTIRGPVLPWSIGLRIQYCSPMCSDMVKRVFPDLWNSTESQGGPAAAWKSQILPAHLARICSLADVLPHRCEVVWAPILLRALLRESFAGLCRWKVDRSNASGGILTEEGSGTSTASLNPLEELEDRGKGGCWCCDFVKNMGGGEPDVEWDLTRMEDWSVSSEEICEGDGETQEWAEELENEKEKEETKD
ncbi:hypothetical protein BDY24DRAFT_374826 [Mrakia frigida]|uniref:F-box protein n=1 Tax=Mrakia frigida TaxID=29902 RepID=UPI003FCC06EA